MRNFSDKSCGENQNTHFMFNNLFPKVVVQSDGPQTKIKQGARALYAG